MISWASMMFSEILLPLTNLYWLVEIKVGRIGLSLLPISLEMILLVKLLTLIVLYSVILFGLFTLGSRTIQEWEKYLGIIYLLKKSCKPPIRSFLIICQHLWKKYQFIPSQPVAELGFIEKTTSLSSSIQGKMVILTFWFWLIILGIHSKECSLISFSSPVKISLNYSQDTWAMLSSPCIPSPFSLTILWINNFLLLLPLITEWKYLELVSPAINHWSCVFCFKILSFILRKLMYFALISWRIYFIHFG